MLSRRSFGKLASALPLVKLPSSVATSIPPSIGTAVLGIESEGSSNFNPNTPKMPRWKAMQTALMDRAFSEAYRSHLFERYRHVERLDPDLEILRSFSPMAKITFQRQRNVERSLNQDVQEERPMAFINKVLDRIMGRE